MIQTLSGALLFSNFVAGLHFCRFWRRTRNRLFLHFAIAFWLFALNQLAVSIPLVTDETAGYEYLLRVLGFICPGVKTAAFVHRRQRRLADGHAVRELPTCHQLGCTTSTVVQFPKYAS
jgi:Family of unknown function (DUF5985)